MAMSCIKAQRTAAVLAAIAALGMGASVSGNSAAAETAGPGSDWPQWRGPTRDGIAPAGPKLLDAWPASGPTRVWKSDTIRAVPTEGGMSSPVGAEGKVILYVNSRDAEKPMVVVSSDLLKQWGAEEGMPTDLVAKVDEVWKTRKPGLKRGPELDAHVQPLLASLDPASAQKYGESIKNRMMCGHDPTSLAGWSKLRDQDFKSAEEAFAAIKKVVQIGHHDGNSSTAADLLARAFPCSDTVICLDAATGKQLWKKAYPGTFCRQLGMTDWGASATPAISGGHCYVQGSAGFYCLSLKDGAEVWKVKTDFSHSSPLVLNGVAYGIAPNLTAYDATTGKVLWKQDKVGAKGGDYGAATSVIPWNDGEKLRLIILIGPTCVDASDGKIIWAWNKYTASHTPTIVGDVLVAWAAMKLTPTGVEKVICGYKSGPDRGGSPTYWDGYVYQHLGGGPRCFDFKTGAEKWKGPGNFGGECGSAILADGKFIGCEGTEAGGTVVMYKASPDGYQQLGRFKLNAAYVASPAIMGGRLFVRLTDGMACYDLTTAGNQ